MSRFKKSYGKWAVNRKNQYDCGAGKEGSKGFQPGNTCGGDGDGKDTSTDQGGGDKPTMASGKVPYKGTDKKAWEIYKGYHDTDSIELEDAMQEFERSYEGKFRVTKVGDVEVPSKEFLQGFVEDAGGFSGVTDTQDSQFYKDHIDFDKWNKNLKKNKEGFGVSRYTDDGIESYAVVSRDGSIEPEDMGGGQFYDDKDGALEEAKEMNDNLIFEWLGEEGLDQDASPFGEFFNWKSFGKELVENNTFAVDNGHVFDLYSTSFTVGFE